MNNLRSLEEIYNNITHIFKNYDGKDFILPQYFKTRVKKINGNIISYNNFSAIIETRGTQNSILNIYFPNQWFYIASYFTELYNELIKYKKAALSIVSKERLKILNGSDLSEEELIKLDQLPLDNISKNYLKKFITDYSWWHGAKTIDRGDFFVSPILYSARLVNASQSYVADLCAYLADKKDLVNSIINSHESPYSQKEIVLNNTSLQQIFYGCPGTGKSHAVKRQTEGESVVRTTFHPDSDYSTFVGCYKPTTKQGPRYTSYGEKAVTIKDAGGKELVEDRIVYEFVDQAFLQAYIRAWKFLAEAEEGTLPKKQYLIIEEINRGNCAQIFGDLFQLLDRNDKGFSDYYIHADKDIQKHLASAFEDLTITDALKEEINSQHQGEDIVAKVLSGEILLLPSNLYIWATMNTSDQSLFPIDSAFKRRWDWKYQPIVKGRDPKGNELNWQIEGDIQNYDWWSFIGKINEIIASTTNSEDKKLGFFFCKAKDGIISAETFVSKVIFYLWNDVFKNFGFDHTIFKDGDGSTLEFDKFYTSSPTGETIVDKAKVEQFLANLEVEATKETIEEVEEDEDVTTGTSDLSKYTINNSTESWPMNALAAACVQKFVELHPDMSAEEVLNTWKPLSNGVPHFIETEEQHNARTDKAKNRCERISCGRTHLYVEKNNYTQKNGKIEALINAINGKKWGIRVDKVE